MRWTLDTLGIDVCGHVCVWRDVAAGVESRGTEPLALVNGQGGKTVDRGRECSRGESEELTLFALAALRTDDTRAFHPPVTRVRCRRLGDPPSAVGTARGLRLKRAAARA